MRERRRRTTTGWLLAALTLGGLLLLPTGPAAASCAADAGPEGSDVIFVGTVETERRGYTRFAVDEVWAGPDLAPEVWVLTGQEEPPWPLSLFSAVSGSVDADLLEGEQYVIGASSSFATSACSIGDLETARAPADVRQPVEGGDPGADPPIGPVGQTLWVGGAVA
jgi:hypothetical protein